MSVTLYRFTIMKKALIAVAAAAAATSCFAQGSVQLFGVIDTGISYGTASPGSSIWQLTSGEWSGSRIGFRGREALGGGLEAGFWLEAGFDSDSGVGKSTSENNVTKAGGDGIGLGGGTVHAASASTARLGNKARRMLVGGLILLSPPP